MKSHNKREYTKDNYLKNGNKVQKPMSTINSFVTTMEQPALNDSGVEAKKKGF